MINMYQQKWIFNYGSLLKISFYFSVSCDTGLSCLRDKVVTYDLFVQWVSVMDVRKVFIMEIKKKLEPRFFFKILK